MLVPCAGYAMQTTRTGFPRYRGGVAIGAGTVGCQHHHVDDTGELDVPHAFQERANHPLVSVSNFQLLWKLAESSPENAFFSQRNASASVREEACSRWVSKAPLAWSREADIVHCMPDIA